jgi:hypothetical protein
MHVSNILRKIEGESCREECPKLTGENLKMTQENLRNPEV